MVTPATYEDYMHKSGAVEDCIRVTFFSEDKLKSKSPSILHIQSIVVPLGNYDVVDSQFAII